MTELKKLMEQRKKMKKKKPAFTRQDAHKKSKLKRSSWRKPKGLHSKIRLAKRGYRSSPKKGYKSPVAVRGFVNGLRAVVVNTLSELKTIDNKNEGVIIGSLGARKKILLLKEAEKLAVNVLNLKNVKDEISRLEDKFNKRVAEKKKKLSKKKEETSKKKQTAKKEEAEKKESVEEKVEDVEKEKKKEKDKVLTKKEV